MKKKLFSMTLLVLGLSVTGCGNTESSPKAENNIKVENNILENQEETIKNEEEIKEGDSLVQEQIPEAPANKLEDGIEYDAAGNKIKEVSPNNDYWEEWEYNVFNKVIKYVKHRKSDDSVMLLREYDDRGKEINAFVRYSDGTEYPLVVLEYDDLGRIIKRSNYNQVDPSVYEGCEEYEYAEGNLETKTKKYNYKNELVRETEHQYDEQGRIVREDYQVYNSAGGHKGYFVYTYEDNGNMTMVEYKNDVLQYTNYYDAKGNLVDVVLPY